MARTDTLGNFLTDVATAIRTKGGTSETIQASQFDTAIANLPSGGGAKLFTGHYDTAGLTAIGWSAEEIQYYQDYGVLWNDSEDDVFELTPSELLGDETSATRFIPKNTSVNNFSGYTNLIALPLINTSALATMSCRFETCISLITIPLLDTSKVTNMQQMFSSCNSLITIPLLDTSKVTNMQQMFSNCDSLITIPLLNTSNVTNMQSMFNGCSKIKTIPLLNTSKVTTMQTMFSNCSKLLAIPSLDTSKVTNMQQMFNGCSRIKTIPSLDTSKVTNMQQMFWSCNLLENIPELNAQSVINLLSFCSSSKLTTFGGLKDIGYSYDVSYPASYNSYKLDLHYSTTLTHDSLMNVINNLYDIATKGCNTQQLVLGSTNLAKLTAEEIAVATAKGWTVS